MPNASIKSIKFACQLKYTLKKSYIILSEMEDNRTLIRE